jgi:hypothetical protein
LIFDPLLGDIDIYFAIVVDVLDIIDEQLIDLPVFILLLIADEVLKQNFDEVFLELEHEGVTVDELLELVVAIEEVEDDERFQNEVV